MTEEEEKENGKCLPEARVKSDTRVITYPGKSHDVVGGIFV